MASMTMFSEIAVVVERDSLLRRFCKSWIPAALTLSLALAPVMISRPAYAADFAQATMEGEMDAKANEGGPLWFFAGFCLGLIGIVVAYVVEPTPPPAKLMGKSADYSSAYSAAYKSAGKKAQGKPAIIGCVVGTVVGIVVYVILVFVVFATATTAVTTAASGY